MSLTVGPYRQNTYAHIPVEMEHSVTAERQAKVVRLHVNGLDDLAELHAARDSVDHARDEVAARRRERVGIRGEGAHSRVAVGTEDAGIGCHRGVGPRREWIC